VLLPSDTHRKPITSITAVLLPSVTYLLTLPSISVKYSDTGSVRKTGELRFDFWQGQRVFVSPQDRDKLWVPAPSYPMGIKGSFTGVK
jgi:hypothetical protein